ncbi:MAG TPA: serine hydrolase [Steroidobacteraceae bacterium]|nr:serine hydrolase [Steroidobacteraceae bacterium]
MSQTATEQVAAAPTQDLAGFEGRYEYRDGLTLFMVAKGEELVAIIGGSKYVLRASRADTFMNPAGDSIPFLRDAGGRIVAFKEYGAAFARLSSIVPEDVRLLLQPRPPGPRGLPAEYKYQRPARLPDGIEVGAAGPGTITPDVAERLVQGVIDGAYPDVRSILVYHQGALRLEEYFYTFTRDRPHEMRSLTKSVIALLAGAAVDRGLLRADEPALARLRYPQPKNPDPRKEQVTLRHLLSNQSGLACNEHDRNSPGKETNLFETDDWVQAFFDVPMVADPGKTGSYCSGGFYAAGKMIEHAAGKSLPVFAHEALFAPLGMQRSDWRWDFTLDRKQRNEFGQIYLRPRDMLKLGLLIRDRGVWQDRRVLSASWVDAAVSSQSRVDNSDYGLGIWHRWYAVRTPNGDQRVDTIMLSGNGGQKVYVVPALDLIVVSTGSAYFVESPLNEMMSGVLLPALLRASQR